MAVKKLKEPFKSSVVAQHMFREVKLLKHLKHENVRQPASKKELRAKYSTQLIQLNDIFISPSEDMYVSLSNLRTKHC